MAASINMIDDLKANVGQLMERIQAEKSTSETLISELEELRKVIKEKEAAYEVLVSKYKTLQVAKSLAGSKGGNGDVKASIHNLVREIDKCIALLNR
jgi:hypothetical protein